MTRTVSANSKSRSTRLIRNKPKLISNGCTAKNRTARRLCLQALDDAILATNPYRCLKSSVTIKDNQLRADAFSTNLSRFSRILILAIGKAAAPMMSAAMTTFGNLPVRGLLVAPLGQRIGKLDTRVRAFSARHPIPDRGGLEAAQEVANAIRRMGKDELLVCLVSGGASAMLPSPPHGVSLEEEKRLTEILLSCKATIHEVNTVRRHLSTLKGGRLVEQCPASTIVSLILSDVPGNYLPDIASGLTVEDPTTYQDAVDVLKKHGLWRKTPPHIKEHLSRGLDGRVPETPKPRTPRFRGVHNIIIADNGTASMAVVETLKARGIKAINPTSSAEMEANQMGRLLGSLAVGCKEYGEPFSGSGAVVVGGETTVEVKGHGKGGRNQEMVLWAARDIAGLDGSVVAGLATDGVDGNSAAAGALADGGTALRAKEKGLDSKQYLARNDSYRFFNALNDNIVTGPTGTNVGDLYLMLSAE